MREGWNSYKIEELGRIVTGKTPSTQNTDYFGDKYPFITPRDMSGQKRIGRTERYLSEEGKKTVKNCLLPANSICISCIGSDMGKVVMTSEYSVTNQQLNSVVCDDSFDPDFVYYSLVNISAELKNAGHHSTAVPILNKTDFSNFEIIAPDLPAQHRIATILSTLDEKIELNRQTNQTLEAIAQALFKEWFVDFNFPGATGEMQDSELGPIPQGWRIGSVGELSYVQNGFAFKSGDFSDKGSHGIIKIKNINGNIVNLNNTQYVEDSVVSSLSTKFYVKPESLLIAMTGAEVGKIGLVPFTENMYWLNQRVGMFIENLPNCNCYLYILLTSESYQAIIKNSALGSAQPNISSSAIENIKVLIPPDEILINFGTLAKTLFDKILYNTAENKELADTRDGLLPRLMTGEIEV